LLKWFKLLLPANGDSAILTFHITSGLAASTQ